MKLKLALSILIFGSTINTVSASDTCKGVNFVVFNEDSRSIKIRKVRYDNITSGRNGRTENIRNFECDPNSRCDTDSNKENGYRLGDAEGRDLANFEFLFQYQEADGDWTDSVWSSEVTDSARPKVNNDGTFLVNRPECIANRQYGGLHWRIPPAQR